MGLNEWLADATIDAIFDKLQKQPIHIKGLDRQERELVIWVVPKKNSEDS